MTFSTTKNSPRRFFRSSVVRNALSLYGIQAANYILPWFTFPYLTRVLGAERFGEIAFAQALITYFQVVTEYGFNFTATREISIHRDDADKLSRIFSATLIAKTILMACSLALLSAIVLLVPRFRGEAPLFFVSFLLVIANVVFPQWLFQGIEKMQHITYREVGARLIGLAPTFLLVKGPSDYLIAATIQSGSLLFAGLAGYLGFSRITTARLTRVTWREIRRTFAEGWHVFLSTAAIVLYTRSNTFILGLIAPAAEVGYFSTAQRLVDAAKVLVFPLSTAIFPHISRLSKTSPEAGMDFIRRNTFRLTAPFAIISAGLFVAAPVYAPLLLGRKFLPSIPLLRIMSPIPMVVGIGTIYATYFMLGMGYQKQWSRLIVSAGALNFALMIPLLLVFKPSTTMAIVSVLVEVWVMAGSFLFFRHKTRHVPGDEALPTSGMHSA